MAHAAGLPGSFIPGPISPDLPTREDAVNHLDGLPGSVRQGVERITVHTPEEGVLKIHNRRKAEGRQAGVARPLEIGRDPFHRLADQRGPRRLASVADLGMRAFNRAGQVNAELPIALANTLPPSLDQAFQFRLPFFQSSAQRCRRGHRAGEKCGGSHACSEIHSPGESVKPVRSGKFNNSADATHREAYTFMRRGMGAAALSYQPEASSKTFPRRKSVPRRAMHLS